MPGRSLNILNLGAGVQSTALYLLSMRQEEPEHVPVYDYAIFADTQEEPQAVYDHLAWLQTLGGPPIITATAGKLGDDLLFGQGPTGYSKTSVLGRRFATIPCFTKGIEDESEGRTRRQCTKEYKIEVIERAIRRQVLGLQPRKHVPKDVKIIQHMGLSFDEPKRVDKVKERYRSIGWAYPSFPLFDMEWERSDCKAYLKDVCPERHVPRSACVFCPYRSNSEWRDIRDNDAAGWARAIEIDTALRTWAAAGRGIDKKLYLHRQCVPLTEANLEEKEAPKLLYLYGFNAECEGMCGI